MANKTTKFLDNLETILTTYSTNEIKSAIGHSTNNNRVPTVNQVILFLDSIGEVALSEGLENVYSIDYVKEELALQRSMRNNRTDGYDINELVAALYVLLETNKSVVRDLGRVVA